jgi:hypothetical protein
LIAALSAARYVAAKYLAEAGMSGFGGQPVSLPILGLVELDPLRQQNRDFVGAVCTDDRDGGGRFWFA